MEDRNAMFGRSAAIDRYAEALHPFAGAVLRSRGHVGHSVSKVERTPGAALRHGRRGRSSLR